MTVSCSFRESVRAAAVFSPAVQPLKRKDKRYHISIYPT